MLPQIPDSRCVKKCSGIPNEICGGNWVSNVYQIRAYDGIAGDCSKAPNVLSNSDIDFDRILFLLNKSSPFNSTLSGNWRGWTLRKANSLNGISNPSSSLMNALNITSNIGFLTIARFGSLDSWGIMLKGTYPIYMALNVRVSKGFWYQFSMTLSCKMAVNDPTILGYLRITHGSNVVLYNLQHHDNQNYSYVKPFEYSILGTKFKANGTMAKIEIWNNKNSFDVFLDDLRLVKLTTKVIRTADWENLEDSECPVSKTLDYADGDLFQCGDFSLDTLHEESTYLNDYSREYSGLLTNWGVKSRYYFNKTQYAMFLDGNAAGGFLRKYPDSQNFNEYDPFDNLRVFEQNKVLDCNVLWGPSAFGRDMTACNLTQSNLILNRRFESNTCSGTGFLCNLNSLQNWSSSDTKFRVYRTNYNGTWSLYLDPQTPRVISQIVNNVKLGYYKLSFWFKGSPGLFMMKSFLSSSGTLPDKDIYYNPFGFGKTDWDWTRHEYDDILRSDPGYENDSFLITFKPNTNNVIGVSYVDEINLVRVKCNGYE